MEKVFKIASKPKTYIDVIKILAIIMVLFNHCSAFTMYTETMEQPWHWLMISHSAIIKMAVPLFYMSSGALLLKKEEKYSYLLLHRVLYFCIVLVAASAVIYVYDFRKDPAFSLTDFLSKLYTNKISVPLWYIYSYISYLLMLPFIRKLAKLMSFKDYVWLLIGFEIMELLSVADYALFRGTQYHASDFAFFTAKNNVLFPLLGYYIDSGLKKEKLNVDRLFVMVAMSILLLGLTCVLQDWRFKMDGMWTNNNAQSWIAVFVPIYAITVFYGIRMMFLKFNNIGRLAKVLSAIGSCIIGVYLFGGIWRSVSYPVYQVTQTFLGKYFATYPWIISALLIGLGCTFVWKCFVGFIKVLIQKTKLRFLKKDA